MADYNHRETEQKWRAFWDQHQTYRTENTSTKPKYYVLDMFPYPSGAGLHVGHPLGYIASDIVSRYKRLSGYNVLHPMGFDSFGLPAEQYAIQTGQHPALTTEQNIATYIDQLKQIGFSYDWSREVRTSDPAYYKWTQWIFMQLFNSWYNRDTNRAEPIETLLHKFATNGTNDVNAVCDDDSPRFTAAEWNALSKEESYRITLKYRLTYVADAVVNFCPALGMVLSNDEVKDGVSERGGYPVIQKLMRQWMMRITAYADRLLTGLDTIDWTESLKEQQRNWIGKSVGASVRFPVYIHDPNAGNGHGEMVRQSEEIEVFTTRVDTIYGVSFMVLAPEHEYTLNLGQRAYEKAAGYTGTAQIWADLQAYVKATATRSERDRMADTKTVGGANTGFFVQNPLNGQFVPVYIADYVLAGYGTGAVMAVPSGDQRDYGFAKHFGLPIIPILDAQKDLDTQADNTKEGRYINSGIIDGMTYKEATATLITWLEERGLGKGKINYRLRDAVFSRQRYWGEPVPVYFKPDSNGNPLPYLIDEADLPLELPAVDKYLPTETGEPPLGRAEGWKYKGEFDYELSTMPGWAGSSFYWYRYMDPQNPERFVSPETVNYWQNVDLYIGGTEHATGHLLYSRFWNQFLYDRGYVPQQEPFKKLINQGMIQGRSNFVYRQKGTGVEGVAPIFVSLNKIEDREAVTPLHVDVNIVDNDVLDVEQFRLARPDFTQSPDGLPATFILEDNGTYICGAEVEKMSKSKFNVVNPDTIVEKYGADVLRLYEMFLGPLEQAKPWNTNGIDGTFRFIRKFWRLFYKDNASGENQWIVSEEQPTPAELKVLHKTIRKAQDDIENYSFNTSVSAFMVCVNELTTLNCHKRAILQDLVLILSPYAPHVCEELWAALGNEPGTISKATWPVFNPAHLVEDAFEYPIQINGKVRTTIRFAIDRAANEIEQEVLADEVVQKWLEGKAPKKVVVVPKRIVNVVL
ncbi:MAG: leucine--tRNA ligase [Cytophagales bacterium]|nr:MAG: leucine--tRNA ligase [Cytophagales bacterium]